MITEEITDGPPRVGYAWSVTPKEDPLGLEVETSPKEVIPGVEDWGNWNACPSKVQLVPVY